LERYENFPSRHFSVVYRSIVLYEASIKSAPVPLQQKQKNRNDESIAHKPGSRNDAVDQELVHRSLETEPFIRLARSSMERTATRSATARTRAEYKRRGRLRDETERFKDPGDYFDRVSRVRFRHMFTRRSVLLRRVRDLDRTRD